MKTIDRAEARKLLEDGAQLIEVLPQPEYEMEHILGAVNIPLKELDAEAVSGLDRNRPVVTYCNGFI